jgi:hypothetical protein
MLFEHTLLIYKYQIRMLLRIIHSVLMKWYAKATLIQGGKSETPVRWEYVGVRESRFFPLTLIALSIFFIST